MTTLLRRGTSAPVTDVRERLRAFASSRPPRALIGGAPGTDRLGVARWLHRLGGASGECVTVRCAQEIDAHVPRRFLGTGRGEEPAGYLRRCAGGTLVLDDVSALPLHLQRLVIVAVETGRLPGDGTERGDERALVAVLREPLERAFCSGRLHRDLYYAMASWTIELPSLDRAVDDLPFLIRDIVDELDRDAGRCAGIEDALVERLARAPWPGNLLQLEACLRALHGRGADGVPLGADACALVSPPPAQTPIGRSAVGTTLVEAKRRALRAALERTHGDKTKAGRLLGVSARSIYAWNKALGRGP